ncbi:MAG: VanZ family protein [Gemmatimonadaceae bacterium]
MKQIPQSSGYLAVSIPAAEPVGDSAESGAKLGGALLGYMLGVTLIITLLPFQFDWPSHWRVMYTGDVIDIVANVLLFLPLGFLYRLARRNASRHSTLTILWIGALLSMAIESAQLFEVERYTSVLDVATNALGAWIGAMSVDRFASRLRIDGTLIGRLSLELPLMGLVYLLIPLLWLNALASGAQVERTFLALLLGVFGASILGGMQRHHFTPASALGARQMAFGAAAWFLIGGFPGFAKRPFAFAAVSVLIAALAWWRGSRPFVATTQNRRFEVPVLQSAAPAYAAYMALLTVAPLLDGVGRWQLGIGFPGVATEWTKMEILRFLELVAACTLLGYMVAEFRGRVVALFRDALPRLVIWGVAVTVAGEFARGWHAGHGASAARGVVLAAALIYGGWLYYLQRSHVVRLLGDKR